MSANSDLHDRRNAALTKGMSTMLPIYIERGQNAEVWDADGRRYIDFAGGIAVLNTRGKSLREVLAATAPVAATG